MKLEDRLRLAEEAMDHEEPDAALEHAEAALQLEPRHPFALELKAQALAELGEPEEADLVFDTLLEVLPKDGDVMLLVADFRARNFDDFPDVLEDALDLLDRAWPKLKEDSALRSAVNTARAIALSGLGETQKALKALDQAIADDSENAEARLERGMALFELGRVDEARQVFEGFLVEWPEEASAHHYLGLIAERCKQSPTRFFERATELAPDDFPKPTHLSEKEFDAAVAQGIEILPEHGKPHLANVVIDVQPIPSDEDVKEGVSPMVLGVFRGKPIDERSPVEAADHQTATITLFQNNLERYAKDRQQLIQEISVTVMHEVGHLLGLDEDELAERGLD